MKNLLFILFLSILVAGCQEEVLIPEGRIESVDYPQVGASNLYTDSGWRTFYLMEKKSFLSPQGFLEERFMVVDSFTSPVALKVLEAKELAISKDAEIVSVNYSTKEWFPSWKKNLSFEKETIRREGSKVVFEKEKGKAEMNFKEFFLEKETLSSLVVIFAVFVFIVSYLLTFFLWKERKDKRALVIVASIACVIFSFLFSFWSGAFQVEIILTVFLILIPGFLFGLATLWFLKYTKQMKTKDKIN